MIDDFLDLVAILLPFVAQKKTPVTDAGVQGAN